VAPTLDVYAVAVRGRSDPDKGLRRALGTFRWGLVPSWAKSASAGSRLINARAEGIGEKPAFRQAFARRRRSSSDPTWVDVDAEPLRTCAIVTTAANELMAPIHDRMPLVLAAEDWATWLDPAAPLERVAELLVSPPSEWFEAYPVGSLVNNVGNEGPDLLAALPPPPSLLD
jgi:putative SOS response-associated peptidase YedK